MADQIVELKEWIHATKLTDDILDKRKLSKRVVNGDPSVVVEEFLHTLAKNNILSAPFLVDHQQNKKIIFVDVLGILTGFMKHFKHKGPTSLTHDIIMKDSMKYFGLKIENSGLLQHATTSQHVLLGSTLFEVAKVLSDFHLHRVSVVIEEEKFAIHTIFSQSDFVYFLNEKIADFGDFSSREIGTMDGIIKRDLITVNAKKTAMFTLELLTEKQVSTVVVVDENNILQDTLVTADFRGFFRDNWMLLEKPVIEFKEYNSHRKAIKCTEKTTFREVIALFVTHKAHQICVVDEVGHATGIVTLTDVISYVVTKTT